MAAEGSKSKVAAAALDLDGHDLPPSPAPSTPRNGGRKYALMTELVYTESSDQYNASSVPIYQVCPIDEARESMADLPSRQPSNRHRRPAALVSTTIRAQATRPARISNATWPRS
jgi:hypothetical protein